MGFTRVKQALAGAREGHDVRGHIGFQCYLGCGRCINAEQDFLGGSGNACLLRGAGGMWRRATRSSQWQASCNMFGLVGKDTAVIRCFLFAVGRNGRKCEGPGIELSKENITGKRLDHV